MLLDGSDKPLSQRIADNQDSAVIYHSPKVGLEGCHRVQNMN